MTTTKAAPRKAPARKGTRAKPNPLGTVDDKPKTDRERIEVLEQQVLNLRKVLAGLMLQNPQVQQALTQKIIDSGEI